MTIRFLRMAEVGALPETGLEEMTFTMNPKGTPLPDNHPFKGGVVISGGSKPVPFR